MKQKFFLLIFFLNFFLQDLCLLQGFSQGFPVHHYFSFDTGRSQNFFNQSSFSFSITPVHSMVPLSMTRAFNQPIMLTVKNKTPEKQVDPAGALAAAAALAVQKAAQEQKALADKQAAEQKALEFKKQQEEAERQLKEREELAQRAREEQEALEAQERAQRLAEEQKAQALQQAHALRVQAAASFWNDKDQREKVIEKFARKAVNLHECAEIDLLNMLASESNDAIIDPINFIKQNPEIEEYQRKFNNRLIAQIKKIRLLQQDFRQALQEITQEDFVHEIHGDEIPAGMLEAAQAHEERQKKLRKALKKTYAERHVSQVDQQQQSYQKFLQRLAKSYVNQADQAYLRGDTFFVQRYQERSAAIIETLTITMRPDGTKTIEHMKQIVVRDKTCNFNMGGMCEKSFFGDLFSLHKNRPIDRLLHREIKTTLRQTSDLIDQYSDNPYAHDNAAVIYHGAASAKLETNSERAWYLSDFCHYFTQATAGLVALTAPVIRCAGHLGAGLVDGVLYNVFRWKNHPIESACLMITPQLLSAGFMLAQAAFVFVTDRKKFIDTCKHFNALRKDLTAEQVCYMLGYFFGPGLTRLSAGKIAKFGKKKFLNSRFLEVVQQQETIKLAIEGVGNFNQNVTGAIQPLRTVVQKAAQQMNQANRQMIRVAKDLADSNKNGVQGAAALGSLIINQIAHDVVESKNNSTMSQPVASMSGCQLPIHTSEPQKTILPITTTEPLKNILPITTQESSKCVLPMTSPEEPHGCIKPIDSSSLQDSMCFNIVRNENELRDVQSNRMKHIADLDREDEHNWIGMGIDVKKLEEKAEVGCIIIDITEKAYKNGNLPATGKFKIAGKAKGHEVGINGIMISGQPQVATAYHAETCCPSQASLQRAASKIQ